MYFQAHCSIDFLCFSKELYALGYMLRYIADVKNNKSQQSNFVELTAHQMFLFSTTSERDFMSFNIYLLTQYLLPFFVCLFL